MRKLLVLLFLLALGLPCLAKDSYVVGVEKLTYYPFYVDDQGDYRGFARELLDAFAARQGIVFEYSPMDVPTLFKSLLERSIDLKFPDNDYWQAALKQGHEVIYSDPVIEYIDGALVLEHRKGWGIGQVRSLGTIKGFTPFPYGQYISKGQIKVVEYSNLDPLIWAILSQEVDFGYFNVLMAMHFIHNISLSTLMVVPIDRPLIVFDPDLPSIRSHYKLSSIKHPQLIEAFNRFMKDESVLLAKLRNKYLTVQ